jgi:hypothetical protein
MHAHLTYIIALERIAEMRAAAEPSRQTAADPLLLADGRRLKIRPIERQDRDRFRALFMRLTPESRYRRYLSPKPALSERELDISSTSTTSTTKPWPRSTKPTAHSSQPRGMSSCPTSQTSPTSRSKSQTISTDTASVQRSRSARWTAPAPTASRT